MARTPAQQKYRQRRSLEQAIARADRTGLSRRARLRIWLIRRVDDIAYWLVRRDCCRAAQWLYKACGLW